MNTVYMLRCRDHSFYIGWTNQFEQRMLRHQEGTASKYTRSRRPVHCVLRITCESAPQARSLEALLKQLNREEKLALLHDEIRLRETLLRLTGSELVYELFD